MSTRKQIIEFSPLTSPTSGDMFITQNVATSAASNISFTNLANAIQSNIDTNFKRVVQTITQNGHGFNPGQIVRFNGTYWELALADTASHSEALGMIESVTQNTFVLVGEGYIYLPSMSFVPGTVYFLSSVIAGGIQTTEPTQAGQISKPMLFSVSTTEAIVYSMRASIVNTVGIVDTVNNQEISGSKTFFNTIFLEAGINNNFIILTGDYDVVSTDNRLICNTAPISANINLVLPFNPLLGETHKIKCVGSNNTIINNNTRNIDMVNGTVTLTPNQSVELQWTGSTIGWVKL